MTPETGTLPQDGTHPKPPRGQSRLQTPQNEERASRVPDHPLVKFKRVWTDAVALPTGPLTGK